MKNLAVYSVLLIMLFATGCRRSPRKKTAVPPRKKVQSSSVRVSPGSDYYVIKKGDSLWAVSKASGYSLDELRRYNGISKGQIMKVGQKIYFPPGRSGKVKTASAEKKVSSGATSVKATNTPVANDSSVSFIWPLSGKKVAGFGQKKGGALCRGIEIAAPALTPYKASAAGKVFHVGPMDNYGVITIIKVSDNLYCLYYAYYHEAIVKKDDIVKQGQVIGYVGKKSPADETGVLHFEIRKRDRAVNPEFYLPKKG